MQELRTDRDSEHKRENFQQQRTGKKQKLQLSRSRLQRLRQFGILKHRDHRDTSSIRSTSTVRGLIAEGNIDVSRGLDHFAVRRNKTQSIDGVGDWNVADLIVLIAHH